jgi:hypothetical protein
MDGGPPFAGQKKDAVYSVGFMGNNQAIIKISKGKQIITPKDVAIVKIFYVGLQSNRSMLSLHEVNIKFE